ncbi:GGDEF domain-containing protein [Marinobacter nauticus]|uniref:diguanylate cyclase n=1 Tax=Marinobacter nauticus (strain ATCC 700491 / DSM 11845 / VT8) TaxID=351348 RepID=A1TXG7_MARN8|nr:GGDEF domain-containing protein [Marinobacter nauticus]ABM17436.1 diguanylate cyclase [Marinobacter nauticus VT8]
MKSGIPSLNLPAHRDQTAPALEDTPPEGLQAVLDNLDALVYVSDFSTHDLLYMNAYGRQIWGNIANRKCWQVLQDSDGPCSFCTNHLLINDQGEPNKPHVWEFQNQLDQRWYQCRDQAIRWTDGRLVRLEIATDITERKQMELELRAAHEKARAAALEDELTGLHNRRAFFEFGAQLLNQAVRHHTPLTLIMMDLDHFKAINDTHGHDAGDEVLRQVSALLQARIRDCDIVARMGGEEFAVLLPETGLEMARTLAERLLGLLQELTVHHGGQSISLSASFGISLLGSRDRRLEDLMCRADEAMYQSKARGRSRVTLAT